MDKDEIHTHHCDIDNSFVDFSRQFGSFEVSFEKKLYDPPQIVVDDERKRYLALS